MKWIGLTGGIASGKSAAKKLIEGLGYAVIDADEIARRVVDPGHEGFQKVVSSFGSSVVSADGLLNRSALADLIFKSDALKQKLESIVHPLIQIEVQKIKSQLLEKGEKICFYDVPLLFEKKLQGQFDATILIWCDLETQKARLKARNSLSDQQIADRLKSQLPMAEKLPLATFCVDNSTTIHNLNLQIKALVPKLLNQTDS